MSSLIQSKEDKKVVKNTFATFENSEWWPKTKEPVTWDDLWLYDPGQEQMVRMKLNEVQLQLLKQLSADYGFDINKPWEMRGAREDLLKSRQQGMSSFWLALYYMCWANLPMANVVMMAHMDTGHLWDRLQQMHERIPEGKRPLTRYSSRKELVREDNGARFMIATSEQGQVLRSGTITHVHLTETSSWEVNADSHFVAMRGSIPEWACVVEESTPNGINSHYRRYLAACKPGSVVKARFFPWFLTERYRLSKINYSLWEDVDYENRDKYKLEDSQIQWYVNKRQEFRDDGKEERMSQEFSYNEEESFVSSEEGAVFPTVYLLKRLKECENRRPIATFKPSIEHAFFGSCEVYEAACDDYKYVIGVDVSAGLKDAKRDWNAAHVGCVDTFSEAASYWSQASEEEFASDLIWLSMQYNNAKLRIEKNTHGLHLIRRLEEMGFTNMYSHPVKRTSSEGVVEEKPEYGYPTTATTRPLIISALNVAIKRKARGEDERALLLNGKGSVEECLHFAYPDKSGQSNRPEGREGFHDDKVFALGLMVQEMDDALPKWTTKFKQPEGFEGYGGSYPKRGRV